MTRFLVDENFPLPIIKEIEKQTEKNFDIFKIIGTELRGIEDEQIIKKASEENRTIVTQDTDFIYSVSKISKVPNGAIIFRLKKQSIESAGKALTLFCSKITNYNFTQRIIEIYDDHYRQTDENGITKVSF